MRLEGARAFMSARGFYAVFSARPDEELRALFNDTLEKPASVDGPHAQTWRSWLVETLLQHFHDHPPQGITA
jgi:hypothetical protein